MSVHPPGWELSLPFCPPDSSHNCLNCCVSPPTRNQFPLPDRDCRYARRVRANAKRENPRRVICTPGPALLTNASPHNETRPTPYQLSNYKVWAPSRSRKPNLHLQLIASLFQRFSLSLRKRVHKAQLP